MAPAIVVRPILNLPAALCITRFADGVNIILINPCVPAGTLRDLCRVLCTPAEREALDEYLAD